MVEKLPWFRFHGSDWLASFSGFSAVERGVAVTLDVVLIERGGPVPLDDERLARQCGVTKAGFKKAIEALIAGGLITQSDGGLMSPRAQIEINLRENRTRAASRAAQKRWTETNKNQSSKHAGASSAQCVEDATRARVSESEIDTDNNLRECRESRTRARFVFEMGMTIPDSCAEVGKRYGLSSGQTVCEWNRCCSKKAAKGVVVENPAAEFDAWLQLIPRYGGASGDVAKSQTPAQTVFLRIERDTPEGRAWEAHARKQNGRGIPWKDDAWHFKTRWPPGAAASSSEPAEARA